MRHLFLLFLLLACRPLATGRTLYLYVTERDSSVYRYTVALARSGARHSGVELVVAQLGDFVDVAKLKKGDSVAFVAYAGELNTGELLAIREGQEGIRFGVWLLDIGRKPDLPTELEGFDAVSSASAERPSKKVGKAFFSQFYQNL